ncbi:MAG: VCBS repeat-containing protein, partial [Desulfobacteraceae bacterium]
AAGDWDGDSDLDLAVASRGANSVAILQNNGSGTFTNIQTISSLLNAAGLAVGDWDGDGDLDLASANQRGNNVGILVNQP